MITAYLSLLAIVYSADFNQQNNWENYQNYVKKVCYIQQSEVDKLADDSANINTWKNYLQGLTAPTYEEAEFNKDKYYTSTDRPNCTTWIGTAPNFASSEDSTIQKWNDLYQCYQKACTFTFGKTIWGRCIMASSDFPQGGCYSQYQEVFSSNQTDQKYKDEWETAFTKYQSASASNRCTQELDIDTSQGYAYKSCYKNFYEKTTYGISSTQNKDLAHCYENYCGSCPGTCDPYASQAFVPLSQQANASIIVATILLAIIMNIIM